YNVSGGELEIQRTMLQLLNQLDGFDPRGDVGRSSYLFLSPKQGDTFTRTHIHTSCMTLAYDVKLEYFVKIKDEFSGANIKVMFTKAGLFSLKEHHMKNGELGFQLLILYLFSSDANGL
ncbi:hypothetical protein MKX03_027095, partial [Papaver bracteatum]